MGPQIMLLDIIKNLAINNNLDINDTLTITRDLLKPWLWNFGYVLMGPQAVLLHITDTIYIMGTLVITQDSYKPG